MKALVTGATGFVGGALARRLIERGDDVRVLVRNRAKLAHACPAAIDVFEGDITDAASVARAMDGVEVVYSIAGTFREPNLTPERYRAVNVDGTRHVLEQAERHGVKRVVHCSTCGIHGNVNGAPANEAHPLQPAGAYEETKAAADELALAAARSSPLEVVVLRPTPVYGPGDTRLLKLFRLANKERTILLGPGTAGYQVVYIDDLVQAFELAGSLEQASGEAFLIGGAEIPSINELMAALAEVLGRRNQRVVHLPATPFWLAGWACEKVCTPLNLTPPIYRRRVEFFTNNRSYDITKARELLGYEPKVALREGLRQTAAWYRSQNLL